MFIVRDNDDGRKIAVCEDVDLLKKHIEKWDRNWKTGWEKQVVDNVEFWIRKYTVTRKEFFTHTSTITIRPIHHVLLVDEMIVCEYCLHVLESDEDRQGSRCKHCGWDTYECVGKPEVPRRCLHCKHYWQNKCNLFGKRIEIPVQYVCKSWGK